MKLSHPNCHDPECQVCLSEHIDLQHELERLTGDHTYHDHLGKYHKWMSDNGYTAETEFGWAHPQAFDDDVISQYVKWFKE